MKAFNTLDFDEMELEVSVPVRYRKKEYILKSVSEEYAIKYENARERCFTRNAEGDVVKIDGLSETEPLLVSYCLFDAETNKRIKVEELATWDAKVIAQLFREAKRISDLDLSTKEGIEKQIAELQKALERVVERDESLKKEQDATQD